MNSTVTANPALTVENLSKTFPGQRALNEVDFTLRQGEIHALIGHNGSGKSTLVKILAGYHEPDPGGRVQVGTGELSFGSPVASRQSGLRFVHQDLGLVEDMSVSDNFRLGADTRSSLALIDRGTERREVAESLGEFGYDIDPRSRVGDLSESERTIVALARALSDWDSSGGVVVLDEVTAAMPGPEAERLFASMRGLAERGAAVLFVSHDLYEVLAVSDRVTVFRDGEHVATEEVRALSHEKLVELMLGRQLAQDVSAHARDTHQDLSGPRQLEVEGLSGHVVDNLSFGVAAGETLGIVGLTGSGREEVAGLLCGSIPRHGRVTMGGRPVPSGRPGAAVEAGLCLVPADRAGAGLLSTATVRENLTIADLGPFWRRGLMSRSGERAEVSRWVEELSIRSGQPETPILALSGGNQQKVVIARWLRTDLKVLVLDEPTQGVDVGSKADIYELVDRAVSNGTAVVVCSTDTEELVRLATTVIVLQRGKVVARLTGEQVTAEQIDQWQLFAEAVTTSSEPYSELSHDPES